jgi:hypothetical protein
MPTLTHQGAHKLAARISDYWQRVAPKKRVTVWVESQELISPHDPTLARTIFVVRSDLMGGRPND